MTQKGACKMSKFDQGLFRVLLEAGFDVSGINFDARTPEEWRAFIGTELQRLDGIRLWAAAVAVLSLVPVEGQERIM